MEISNQNTRLPSSKKPGKLNSGCSKCKKIPSGENCLKCFINLLNWLNSDYYEDETLSTKEQVAILKRDLDKLKPVLSIFIQIFEAYIEKKSQLEKKILELMTKADIEEDDAPDNKNIKLLKPKKKVQIPGKKSDVAQKVGKFFFNPNFKDGLGMPRTDEETIIEFFCEFFESINGTNFGSRYFLDNVNTGAIKDRDKKYHG